MDFIASLIPKGCLKAAAFWAGARGNMAHVVSASSTDKKNARFEFFLVKRKPQLYSSDEVAYSENAVISGVMFSYASFLPVKVGSVLEDQSSNQILETDGGALSQVVWGNYSGLFFDAAKGRVIAVRDPTGGRALYYVHRDDLGIHIFSNSLPVLCEMLGDYLSIDYKMIELSLAYRSGLPTRRTGFSGISSLLPGECMVVDANIGRVSSRLPWWERVCIKPKINVDLSDCLEQVVDAWSLVSGKVALQLSGGLDSSGLLGAMAALGRVAQVESISYFSPCGSADERYYAKLAAQHANGNLTEIDSSEIRFSLKLPDIYKFSPRPHGKVLDRQLEEAFDECARASGCQTHWLGYGGDTLFVNEPGTSLIIDAARLKGLRAACRVAVDLALFKENSLWRTAYDAAFRRECTDSFVEWAERSRTPWRRGKITKTTYANELSFSVLDDCFQGIAAPGDKSRMFDIYYEVCSTSQQTHFYTAGGIGYVRPYLSEPFIDAALSTPAFETMRHGLNRYPQREAVTKVMPEEIGYRITKGGADDQLVRAIIASAQSFKEGLENGLLRRHGFIESEDTSIPEDELSTSPSKYMYTAVIMSVENWLSGHADVARL